MGMETRRNGRYYYRKERQGKHVVSSYVGTGATADLIARCEAWRKAEELQQRAAIKHEQQAITEQGRVVLNTEANLRELVSAVLIANGFHQHKRQWRKTNMETHQPIVPATTAAPAPVDDPAQLAEARAALSRAFEVPAIAPGKRGKALEEAKSDAQAARRKAVRNVLQAYPVLWSGARRMFTTAEDALIESLTSDGLVQEFMEFGLKGIRRDLGYEAAPMLEKLLIEQVALAWLDLNGIQQRYATATSGSHTHASGAYWDRRVTGAQARYTRAVEALARVRRLAMPQPLQVNIGGQQVNVAGGRSIGANGEAP